MVKQITQKAQSTTPQVWQIAAGERGRYYADLFLNHDIMFLGPGRFGEFSTAYQAHIPTGELRDVEYDRISDFVHKIQLGDIVLLRTGQDVRGIGRIVGGYEYCAELNDIYGWDLQHFRRVRWQPQLERALQGLQFGASRGRTLSQVREDSLVQAVKQLTSQFDTVLYQQDLRPLPGKPSPHLGWDEVKQELYNRGMRFDAAERTVSVLEQIVRLADWYYYHCPSLSRPTEHEVVAHMVVPLLLALGWSEQQLAVEWRNIDLAAFWGMPSVDHCVLVCEVKGRGRGLQDVIDQADNYVEKRSLTGCRRILITDGTCYYLYDRDGDSPVGYFNVYCLRTNHLAPAGTNAIDTIIALTPAGISQPIPKGMPSQTPITASVPLVKMIGG